MYIGRKNKLKASNTTSRMGIWMIHVALGGADFKFTTFGSRHLKLSRSSI